MIMAPLFLARPAVAADDGLHLTTSPLPINLSTSPGKSVTADLRVKQDGSGPLKLKITLYKFSAFGEEGKPQILDPEPGDDYFSWVSFDKPVFEAAPGVWQTIHMTINVPKTAAFGYYYAPVFSRADEPVAGARSNALNGGTAVMVLLDVLNPGAKRVLSLESFSAEHRLVEFLPDRFNVKLHNSGNVHVVPHGTVFILNGKKEVGEFNINAEQGNILPNTNRIYFNDWSDGFPRYELKMVDGKLQYDKKGKPQQTLKWNLADAAKFRFGRYTAHLIAVYDDGQRDVPLESTITFWVVPWRALLVLLLIVSLVGLGVYFSLRGVWRGATTRRRRGQR
jgi:hypothetical protein